jgi:hypothetical protein
MARVVRLPKIGLFPHNLYGARKVGGSEDYSYMMVRVEQTVAKQFHGLRSKNWVEEVLLRPSAVEEALTPLILLSMKPVCR